ncbi:hypothetical protein R0K04_23290, partial [Pseudoalteromonas sp. SIMBA_153]
VAACDVSLWGIEFAPQGRRSLLRIYIEALPEEQAQDKQELRIFYQIKISTFLRHLMRRQPIKALILLLWRHQLIMTPRPIILIHQR